MLRNKYFTIHEMEMLTVSPSKPLGYLEYGMREGKQERSSSLPFLRPEFLDALLKQDGIYLITREKPLRAEKDSKHETIKTSVLSQLGSNKDKLVLSDDVGAAHVFHLPALRSLLELNRKIALNMLGISDDSTIEINDEFVIRFVTFVSQREVREQPAKSLVDAAFADRGLFLNPHNLPYAKTIQLTPELKDFYKPDKSKAAVESYDIDKLRYFIQAKNSQGQLNIGIFLRYINSRRMNNGMPRYGIEDIARDDKVIKEFITNDLINFPQIDPEDPMKKKDYAFYQGFIACMKEASSALKNEKSSVRRSEPSGMYSAESGPRPQPTSTLTKENKTKLLDRIAELTAHLDDNKALKQHKIDGLNEVIRRCDRGEPLAEVIPQVMEQYPRLTEGFWSSETEKVLKEICPEAFTRSRRPK